MCLGIPAQIVEVVDEADQLVRVDISGVRRTVSLALLGDEAAPGDWVVIHVGFALSKIDEEEARATIALLEQIGEPYEQELEDIRGSAADPGAGGAPGAADPGAGGAPRATDPGAGAAAATAPADATAAP